MHMSQSQALELEKITDRPGRAPRLRQISSGRNRFGSTRFGCGLFEIHRFGSVRFGSVRFGSAGSVRFLIPSCRSLVSAVVRAFLQRLSEEWKFLTAQGGGLLSQASAAREPRLPDDTTRVNLFVLLYVLFL